jgi:signal transduction histidine kinase/ActR/RegA family two-component response regulator
MPEINQEECVIVIAPVGQDAEAMASLLSAEGFHTEILHSLAEGTEKIPVAGVLLLTEEALEISQVADFLEALRSQPPWSELPLVILTSGGETRLAKLLDLIAEAARSVTLLERPMTKGTLVRSLQVAMRSRRRQYQMRDLLEQEKVLRGGAEEANRIKDEFLATVSHELRTPLNAILGWATLILRGKLDLPTTARGLEAIERNAKAQAQLIEDLLDISRMISGKLRLSVKPIELITIIKGAVDSVQPAFEAHEVQLEMVFDAAADRISADANRLQQVVWNLLSNAVKFTPRGGRVQIKLQRIKSQARITVTDNGAGITAEFLPHVFETFRQADGTMTRGHAGLGLGLAIARSLVEMHGGTISASSDGENQGATFTVNIPIISTRHAEPSAASDAEDVANSESASNAVETLDLSGVTVLAVDDEADTREMIRGVLEQFGADVVTASSAGEAFEVLQGLKPDVLVCDIGMPGEDGYALIKRVRGLPADSGKNTLAIALTGYVRINDRMRALDSGYQMFVPKPVEADELAMTVANLIGRTTGKSDKPSVPMTA